jgi:hypothetical protein
MSHKILITISDELKAMIDKYNQANPFEPLHISELSAKAIFEKITSLDKYIVMEKPEVMKVNKKESNEKEVRLHDINVEYYTDKLEYMVDKPEHYKPEPSHKAPIPIHETIHRLHSEPILEIQEPVKKEPEPSHKAPVPIHEHIHKLHSESIPETVTEKEEPVNEADFFDNEPDTTENTKEEPIYEVQTYKDKKELTLKQCEVCGKTFPAKTKRTVTCSPDCQKAKSREKRKEKASKK